MKRLIGNANGTYLYRNEPVTVLLSAVFFTMALLVHAGTAVADKGNFSLYVDKSGNIRLPDDFRLSMTHLGSLFVPEGEASGFHDVYTEPETAKPIVKPGNFRTAPPWSRNCVRRLQAHTLRAKMSAMRQGTSSNGL